LFENVMVLHTQRMAKNKKLIEFDLNVSPEIQLINFGHRFVNILLDKRSIDLMRLVISEAGHSEDFATMIWPGAKLPLIEELRAYLQEEVNKGRLQITNFDYATRQFAGLVKEILVWPVLMGLEKAEAADERDQVIRSAVAMFLARYGIGGFKQ
jgi:hypothetical protein